MEINSSKLYEPGYLQLHTAGELQHRTNKAISQLAQCAICPHKCNINRLNDEIGVCRTGRFALVSSYGRHYGEEDVLVGSAGSGTIFFANCNLACVFCQNYEISAGGAGRKVTSRELAEIMLNLQIQGCHNINLVSPSHVVPQILEALLIAVDEGLKLPLVYNSGGYDALPTVKLLEGVVDIYMPDFKSADDEIGKRLTKAPNYGTIAKAAIQEMHRQVGDLVMDSNNIARRGLLLRHLVMPNLLDDTASIMEFIAQSISPDTFVNVMGQYYPAHLASTYSEINRPLEHSEYKLAVTIARKAGLHRLA